MTSRVMKRAALRFGQNFFRAQSTMSAYEIQHKTPLTKKITSIPIALYGGRNAVSMLPGGGIGPELMAYVREVFKYAGAPVDFEIIDLDPKAEDNDDLDYAITSIKRNGVALKGNIETKSKSSSVLSRNVAIRNELDLFINILHVKSYPGVPARQKDIDIVIIRQNTEGEYAMLEHEYAEVKYVPVRKKRYHVLVLVNVWLKNHTRTNLIPKHSAPETEEIMDEHSDSD